ncbi:phage terminase large subunit family protein [Burkholderia cenocepacia]|nr:phage terminase large subunit family protein [Burkholderia cenocepacia]
MSAKATASPGRYNPNITPWVFGMHAALDDPRVQKVVCMKSAQVAWTDGVLLNYIGRRIDVDPCPMIVMFAKEKSAKKFNLEKFEPMVEVTPRLASKVPVHAGRDKNNLWDHKTFPRGFLKFITSNAPDDVKSTPAPVVAVEEPDDANTNVRDQGDSITLLEERNKSYSDSRRKVIFGGTPTVDGFSRIQQAFESSDQRVYLVPCPDCGEEHELAWENVTWSEEAEVEHEVFGRAQPETARYTCPHCGSLWDDNARIRAVRRGRWVATAPFYGVAGFRLNELVSPFPGSRMGELVKKWLTAERALRAGDDTKMRSFVNNTQGRPYKYKSDLPEPDQLAERALPYAAFTVPSRGLLLTIGVDVQHDRIAVVIRAWGRGEESWLVLWDELHGNVLEQGQNPLTGGVWGALTELLTQAYRHESGGLARIRAASIDSSDGSTSDAVYRYVRAAQQAGLNVMAIKGSTDVGAEIFSVPKASIDSTRNNSKAAKYGLRPFMVGVSKAKDLILDTD